MSIINRSIIVPYSIEQMYTLINDVAEYKNFVPWCMESIVHEKSENKMHATLTFSAKGIQKSFTTMNTLQPNQCIEMQLVQGPFKQLAGLFRFENRDNRQTEVIFNLSYELSNPIFSMMYGSLFHHVSSNLVDAFVNRAHTIYGSK